MAKGRVEISEKYCKGCSLCIYACPKKVLSMSSKINSKGYRSVEAAKADECIACSLCAMTCPDAVISVFRVEEGGGAA